MTHGIFPIELFCCIVVANESVGIFEDIAPIEEDNLDNSQNALFSRPQFVPSEAINVEGSDPTENEEIDELSLEFMVTIKERNYLKAIALLYSGADPNILNQEQQNPFQFLCLSTCSNIEIEKLALTLLDAIWPRIRRKETFNNLDLFGDTPLSIMLTRDVWAWSERNAFPNNRERPNVQPIKRIVAGSNEITKRMLKNGASLKDIIRPDGFTPWHTLASRLFSNKLIPGFTGDMHPIIAVLIVRSYKIEGNLDLNLRNSQGQTGLDILKMRKRTRNLSCISDDDFDFFVDELKILGCQCR
jgi:ankyrin repeat protein